MVEQEYIPEHKRTVVRKVTIEAPEVELEAKVTVYKPAIVEVPDFIYVRTPDGSEYEKYVGDKPVIKAFASVDFDYDSWLYDFIEEYISKNLSRISWKYDGLGTVIDWGWKFTGEREEVELEINPWHDVPMEKALKYVSDTFPDLVVNAVVEGVRGLCKELRCRVEVREELTRSTREDDDRELVTA